MTVPLDHLTWAAIFEPATFKALVKVWLRGIGLIIGMLILMEVALRAIGWAVHRRSDQPRRPFQGDWPANFVLHAINTSVAFVISKGLLLAAMSAGYAISHWRIPVNAYTLALYFLAAEFCFYFYHRLSHEVRLFWADHSMHHSSEDYSILVVYRAGPFAFVYQILTYTPVAMLGFDPVWLLVMIGLSGLQGPAHTARIGRLGWFDYVFCSPANHGIHHASNPRYIDKNYGGATVIWDHVFGTFQMPAEERIKYGVTTPIGSDNPLTIWMFEFRNLWLDFRHAPGARAKFLVLFGRPGDTFSHKDKPGPCKGAAG